MLCCVTHWRYRRVRSDRICVGSWRIRESPRSTAWYWSYWCCYDWNGRRGLSWINTWHARRYHHRRNGSGCARHYQSGTQHSGRSSQFHRRTLKRERCHRPISRVLYANLSIDVTVISLDAQSPTRSSSLPAAFLSGWTPFAAYLALLPLGFAEPHVLPHVR